MPTSNHEKGEILIAIIWLFILNIIDHYFEEISPFPPSLHTEDAAFQENN